MTASKSAFFDQQVPIDAYGNGGFRFAGMSHRGSLIISPGGVYGWQAESALGLEWSDFTTIHPVAGGIEVMLLGTGVEQIWPSKDLRLAFEQAGIGLETMNTGAAVRTYNVLLSEQRAVSAALIAVESSKR